MKRPKTDRAKCFERPGLCFGCKNSCCSNLGWWCSIFKKELSTKSKKCSEYRLGPTPGTDEPEKLIGQLEIF